MGNLCGGQNKGCEYMDELFDIGDEKVLKTLLEDSPLFEETSDGVFELTEKDIGSTYRRISTFDVAEKKLTIQQLKNNEDSQQIRVIPFSSIIKFETKRIGEFLKLKDESENDHEGMIRVYFYDEHLPQKEEEEEEEEEPKKKKKSDEEKEDKDEEEEKEAEKPPEVELIKKELVETLYRRDLLYKHIQPLCDEINTKVFEDSVEVVHIQPPPSIPLPPLPSENEEPKEKVKQEHQAESEDEKEKVEDVEAPQVIQKAPEVIVD